MKSLILTSIFVFLVLCCANHVSSRPLNQNDVEIDEEIIFPATTTTLPSAAAITSPPSSTPTTDPTMIETTPSAVSELLAAIFRQTIYTRIESLLLDPGKRSEEKQKIVDSAVSNYHRQKMFDDDDNDATDADDGDKVENVTREESDISKSTGFWIRETKEANRPGSISILESSEDDDHSDGLDYQTESYHIADLFVATTTPK